MKTKLSIMLAILFLMSFPLQALAETSDIEWITGPRTVDMGSNLAKLDLPAKYVFTGEKGTKKIMEKLGNPLSNQEIGMVVPDDDQQDWFIIFEYDALGFVKDDDANKLDADKILASIKKGTEQANKERSKDGVPPLTVVGWDEKPHYDSATHNLVWSIIGESENHRVVNFNTRVLGRRGVTSITLVASPEQINTIKPDLAKIIGGYTYVTGNKYSDFVPGKDKVAEYGLTALVAGGVGAAAAKAGLLAKILLIFKKAWFILFAAIGGIFKGVKGWIARRTGRGKNISSQDTPVYPEPEQASGLETAAADDSSAISPAQALHMDALAEELKNAEITQSSEKPQT